MKILVAGDYFPCGRVRRLIDEGRALNVFLDVVPYINAADYSIVNLECSVAEELSSPIGKCGPNLGCKHSDIEILHRIGFKCVSLANNHFYDYGDDGVCKTLLALNTYGIDYVGGGKNPKESARVLYKEITGRRLAIVNCCESEFSIAEDGHGGSNPLDLIKQFHSISDARQQADFVLVIVHGGIEHYNLPTPRMQETYRFFVDIGANAVVNHHQHCYSGYEIYHGAPIFYGLGNFCFDKDNTRGKPWNFGVLLELNFEDTISFSLIPYTQCDDNPCITPLAGEALIQSQDNIKQLCEIILDTERLQSFWVNLMDRTSRAYLLPIQPYLDPITKRLYYNGLIPSLLNKNTLYKLIDFIQCESHRERLLYSIKHFISVH